MVSTKADGVVKAHEVVVSITSYSHGEVNQEVLCRELAVDEAELVMKNFKIAEHVVPAIMTAMHELAAESEWVKEANKPSGKK